MNEIDEALEYLERFKSGASCIKLENTRFLVVIMEALTAAKEREAVDVDGLKREYKQKIYDGNRELRADTVVWMQHTCETVINTLVYEGHLTSSEKPTHSIPEGYALVPVEPPYCDIVFECPYKLTDVSTEKTPLFILEKKVCVFTDMCDRSDHRIYKFYDKEQAIMRLNQMWFKDYHEAMIKAAKGDGE